jgi:hypothetical protein
MSDFASSLPARPSLEQLHKLAKELLRQARSGDSGAADRFRRAGSRTDDLQAATLADAQFVLAREYGFESWARLKHHIEEGQRPRPEEYIDLAQDLVAAYDGDAVALHRVNARFGSAFTRAGSPFTAAELRARIEEHLNVLPFSASSEGKLTQAQAQLFIARQYGFENWTKLLDSMGARSSGLRDLAHGSSSRPPFYRIDWRSNTIEPGPILSSQDWDRIFAVMKEYGITGLNAGGRMTDEALGRLAKLHHVRRVNLDGSIAITDAGLVRLVDLPLLEELDISGPKGAITDRGLDVLRHLPELRRFAACWQQNISDAGIESLSACDRLESVNLLGTQTGDGAVRACTRKPNLRRFKTGRRLTDVGLMLLHEFPAFKAWQGDKPHYSLMSAEAGPTHLLLDGPFTDEGLGALGGLEGLFGLSFFWHSTSFTSKGLERLKNLPNLGFLGCQGERCDDAAMRCIAELSRLRMLMAQGTVATDAGFTALSRSQTIEYIWGRECPNLTGAGFSALAAMPALRGLAVSCRHVEDAALSVLPRFPALEEFMPMDVDDAGFRHVGRCKQLKALWCMYCRDTGDAATEHIAGLTALKTYYAGRTQITDRSLEILGQLPSLERIELWQCARVTDAGVAHLAALPCLREITLGGLPGVTRDALSLFPPHVRVVYSP